MSRKLDLSRFRDDGEDDETPRRELELTDLKRNVFSRGVTKKTKKDLEREAEEKKRIEEEKAAALALAEYEDAFEKPSGVTPLSSGGMRSFGAMGGNRTGGGFVRAGGAPMPQTFRPPSGPSGPPGVPKGPSAMGYAKTPSRMTEEAPMPSSGSRAKGKRVMDSFLEEIKSNQAVREQRLGKKAKMEGSSVSALAAWEGSSGGRAYGEEESTNLFVGSLPGNVTEESLGLFFAKIGPVGTVKIMWPRGDIDASIGGTVTSGRWTKSGLQGFVAFMKRKDAEKAVKDLDGMEWGDSVLRVGWSKPVPIPARAIYDLGASKGRSPEPSSSRHKSRARSPSYSISPSPPPTRRRRKSRSSSGSYSRSRSRSPPRSKSKSQSAPQKRGRSRSRSRSYSSYSSSSSRSRSRSRSPPPKKLTARERWMAKIPTDQEKFIKAVATKVRQHGKGFEEVLRTREKENPKFDFLFNPDKPDYHLYRSTLSSRYRIPTPPPDDFEDDGYASMYSSDSAEDSEKERTTKGKVGKLGRKRFEAMLRAMSGKRAEIARAMEFAIKRAESADDVADVICQSLQLYGTPVPRKIARLHLVSDILHNSASPLPNVWKYRLAFESRLPEVFAHLAGVGNSLRAYSGNISADVFKSQVMTVLEIWERWIIFTGNVNEHLRQLFLGERTLNSAVDEPENASQRKETAKTNGDEAPMSGFKTGGFKSSFKPLPAVEADTSKAADDDVDGEPMEDPAKDDGKDMELDGEPIEEEDLDGEAMDEDVDGEPM